MNVFQAAILTVAAIVLPWLTVVHTNSLWAGTLVLLLCGHLAFRRNGMFGAYTIAAGTLLVLVGFPTLALLVAVLYVRRPMPVPVVEDAEDAEAVPA